MTDGGQPLPCPAAIAHGDDPESCECSQRWFGSANGAVMHAVNKTDGYHGVIATKADASDALDTWRSGGVDGRDRNASGVEPVTPSIPDSGDSGSGDSGSDGGTVDCPNCGADTGETEAGLREFVDHHGAAYCEGCGYRLVAEGSA